MKIDSKDISILNELIKMDALKRERIGKNAYNYAMKNFSIITLAKKNAAIYRGIYYSK